MKAVTKENFLKEIDELKKNHFSFEDLKKSSTGNYDELKDMMFELLDDPKSGFTQFYDETHEVMRFARGRK